MTTPYPTRLILEQLLTAEILRQRCDIMKLGQAPAYLYVGRRMMVALNRELRARNVSICASYGDRLYGATIIRDANDPWRLEVSPIAPDDTKTA